MNPLITHIKEFNVRLDYKGTNLDGIIPSAIASIEQTNLHKNCARGHLVKILNVNINDLVINTIIHETFMLTGYYVGLFLDNSIIGNFIWLTDKKYLANVCGCVTFKLFKPPKAKEPRNQIGRRSRQTKQFQNNFVEIDLNSVLSNPEVKNNGGKIFSVHNIANVDNNKIIITLIDPDIHPFVASYYFDDDEIDLPGLKISRGEMFKITPSIIKLDVENCDPSNLIKTNSTTVIGFLLNNNLLSDEQINALKQQQRQ